MCRPSCCDKNGGQGTGIAAVALIIGAALIAAKIGPIVAHIIHVVLEVIRLVALTTGLVVALAAITGAAITITRWQLWRKALAANATQMVTAYTIRVQPSQPAHSADCLACGGTGTVLRAIGTGRYQPGECPVCEPIKRAR
jgi:hypothetical protein